MKLLEFENWLMVDIDETLITKINPSERNGGYLTLAYGDTLEFFDRCNDNIALMVHHKKTRGYGIIAWSANGKEWAEKVVTALELEQYVDYIMTKPMKYLDDKPVETWMTSQIYLGTK